MGKTTALKNALHGRGIYETADYPTPLPYTVIDEWWNKALAHPDKILAIDEIQDNMAEYRFPQTLLHQKQY